MTTATLIITDLLLLIIGFIAGWKTFRAYLKWQLNRATSNIEKKLNNDKTNKT